ncbi:hypothetical protein D1872_298460 [compost metagenome]
MSAEIVAALTNITDVGVMAELIKRMDFRAICELLRYVDALDPRDSERWLAVYNEVFTFV